MKLADLAPKWIALGNWASPDPFWVGVSFQCPHCVANSARCPTCGHEPHVQRLNVFFANAIDPTGFVSRGVFDWPPNAAVGVYAADNLCEREGETFETLTVIPNRGYLRWEDHGGFEIVNGEVRQCA